jgi:hypothetical protein
MYLCPCAFYSDLLRLKVSLVYQGFGTAATILPLPWIESIARVL